MQVNSNPQPIPQNPPKADNAKRETTLDKAVNAVKENTADGTFIGDNMLVTGAGALVGTVAAGSAVNQIAQKVPAVKDGLKFVFVENGELVGSGAALATSALLAEDAIASYKEGDKLKAGLEGAGAAITGLGGVELAARRFNVPVLNRALTKPAEVTAKFIQNHGVAVLGTGLAGAGAYAVKEGVQDAKDGNYMLASAKLAGGSVAALGGAELIGRNYNIPGLNKIISKPALMLGNFAKKNAGGLGGGALAAAGSAAIVSGVQDLKEGSSMLGGAKLAGGTLGVLGGTEIVGRTYDIPIAKSALSGTANWVKDNVKAATGTVALAGSGIAIHDGVKDIKDGNTLMGSAKIAGGAVGVLGGAELIGRNYNIPVLDKALTGTVKAIFTSKAGIIGSGGAVALSGVGAAADGVRRLTTEKGILNDAIGVAEFTAGVAGVTGGASIIGYATGSEKLMRVFPENVDVLGGSALVAGGAAMAKYTAESVAKEGLEYKNIATGAAAAAMATGGAHIVTNKFGVEAADALFAKGYETIGAAGLAAASYKLGEHAVKEGAKFVADTDDLTAGAKALGLGTASVAAAAGTLKLAGKAANIGLVEKAGEKILEKGWQPALATGLAAASYKLGEYTLEQGKGFVKDPSLKKGAIATGVAAATLATGATSVGLYGHAFNIPVLEQASMKVLNGVGTATHKTVQTLGKGAEKVLKGAVEHPFLTLGALAAAAGAGYYIYSKNKDAEAEVAAEATKAAAPAEATQAEGLKAQVTTATGE